MTGFGARPGTAFEPDDAGVRRAMSDFPKFEAVLPGDPRGQPVPYYRGLVAIVSHDPRISIVTADGSTFDSTRWIAVAHLLAAAPEMLEALDAAEACMSIVVPRSDKAEYLQILGTVRAAIAKARP